MVEDEEKRRKEVVDLHNDLLILSPLSSFSQFEPKHFTHSLIQCFGTLEGTIAPSHQDSGLASSRISAAGDHFAERNDPRRVVDRAGVKETPTEVTKTVARI